MIIFHIEVISRELKKENNPDYIMKAVDKGFDVEIDVWFKNNDFYLGHDSQCLKLIKNLFVKNFGVMQKILKLCRNVR